MNLIIKNKENPVNDFKSIAQSLLNDKVLFVADNYYRFTCIEFYYFETGHHADIYSHQHDNQKTNGKWYFHGSGLDITFGSEHTYGGILIRGIKNLSDGKYINGPILCVQELFNNLGSVQDDRRFNFYIAEIPQNISLLIEKEKVYNSRRVGLNEKMDKSVNSRFYNSHYRFYINPKETQKDKGKIAIDLLSQGYSESEINELFGYKHYK